MPTDYAFAHFRTFKPGDRPYRLRPAQVAVHYDGKTHVYDLSGYGKGAAAEFEDWAATTWDAWHEGLRSLDANYPDYEITDRPDCW